MSAGVTSGRAYQRLSRSDQRHYASDVEVRDLERSRLATSFRQAFIKVYRRAPSGRDYERIERNLAGAYERRGQRLRVRPNDRLWLGDEPLPVLTPDGVYDAVAERLSWRQRSVIGEYWSLIGRANQLSDAALDRELRRFRQETYRVFDPESGRVVRLRLETDPDRFRAFAASPEARQERVISPRVSPTDLGRRT
jgi:hypothetical protein